MGSHGTQSQPSCGKPDLLSLEVCVCRCLTKTGHRRLGRNRFVAVCADTKQLNKYT